jgi:hypothetical protein
MVQVILRKHYLMARKLFRRRSQNNLFMRLFTFILLFISIASCSKEKLHGEAEELQGTWRVTYISGEDYGTHAPIDNQDENFFEIRFNKNGSVLLFDVTGNLIERGRIKYHSSNRLNDFPYTLYIDVEMASNQLAFSKLERINSLAIDGFFNDQVLRISDFTKDKGIDEFYFSK